MRLRSSLTAGLIALQLKGIDIQDSINAHGSCLVAQSSWPRGWSGAGVGVGMSRGKGLLGFKVSWFQSCLISWFKSVKVSKTYQFSISRCQEDIGSI